jgi:hypothetical protein
MSTATRDPNASRRAETLTRRLADGTILALSSIGGVEYVVSLSPASCQCQGFAFRGCCRHLVAAQERYAPQPSAAQEAGVVAFLQANACHICGNPLATGHDYRRIGGGRELDLPICRAGDVGDHAAN